jgi:hypothetical protein
MKFKVIETIPAANEIASDLRIERDTDVVEARERARAVRLELQRAQERLREAQRARADRAAAVAKGEATPAQLEADIGAERAAALVLPHYEPRIRQADADVERVLEDAKRRAIREAGRRRDRLQLVADNLTPALNALREAEAALDEAVRAFGVYSGVEPLQWPSSLDDEGAQRNSALMGGAIGRPGVA